MSADNDPSILLDHLHQVVLCIDESGRVNYSNESASRFWQRDSSRLCGTESGRLFREDTQILDNLSSVYSTILRAKPEGVKGALVKKVTLCTTMGPSFHLDQAELQKLTQSG